jgi:hypothetical protein
MLLSIQSTFYISTSHIQGFQPTSFLKFVRLFLSSHPNVCEMVYHCGFDICFPKDQHAEYFSCVYYLIFFFGEMFIQIFCKFLNWVVWFFSHWIGGVNFYIADVSPSSDVWLGNICSRDIVCLLYWSCPLCSPSSHFKVDAGSFGIAPKNTLWNPMSWNLLELFFQWFYNFSFYDKLPLTSNSMKNYWKLFLWDQEQCKETHFATFT